MMTHYDSFVKRILDKNGEKIEKTSISDIKHNRYTFFFLSEYVKECSSHILSQKNRERGLARILQLISKI